MSGSSNQVIVGVVAGQPASVLRAAAVFAKRFDAELLCVSVDSSRYVVERLADGSVTSLAVNAEMSVLLHESFDTALESQVAAALEGLDVRWSTRALAGGPAQELGLLAEQVDASMIVVGTREPGIRGGMREFVNGSVAVQLAHRQHRPVVVIPLTPVSWDDQLPWADPEEKP